MTFSTDTNEQHERRIVCAAVRMCNGRVICGVRHFDQLMIPLMPPNTPEGRAELHGHEQGFVDNRYQFVSRAEAFDIALAAKQFDPDAPTYRGIRGTLFSEDVW